ncbi:D-alanyl-D-alanine carboxypeptidase [Desulfocucumis palustris]|uniref:serine-type D-Ala-D-Ala carboxypeptidase n=1 Tax=Desulfocucumis palustris TaxID=1898651 RepID=A0A2L2XGW2_9FIRM|nr:D-alanyl-D-alanine carboxypeptidase family protein [Desulfocucumis palustris]GBF35445.1 D-alanyl-D-alanine carboxypeptidase [Desulfocucumis palustris]
MFKKAAVLVLVLFQVLAFTGPALAKPPGISALAGVLMDAGSGQIYYSKKGDVRREPASLTKIMTAILAIENGNLEELVTVSPRAASVSVGQDIGLKSGDSLTLENLVKAALIYSANDSTVAIAEHIGGTEQEFIRMMNAKAVLLGAYSTRFANTNGYHHPNHYTTARDLAVITRYALGNKKFAELVGTPETTILWADGRKKEIRNTNRLLKNGSYQGLYGVKTGTTLRAGDCLVAAAARDGRNLIAVVLHCGNRYNDAVKLLDYGFDHFNRVTLCRFSEKLAGRRVEGGVLPEVALVAGNTAEVYLPGEDVAKVKREIKFDGPVRAPVRRGQRLGEVVYSFDGKELARVELVSAVDVKKPGPFGRLYDALDF